MTDINISKIRLLDGGLLLVLRELLRSRNATAVAKRLNLSQSAISHALGRLRDVFEDPLFVRQAHGLWPTRRALELEAQVETLLQLTAAAIEGPRRFDPAAAERVFALALPEFVAATIGGSLLERVARLAPAVRLWQRYEPQEAAIEALRTGDIDLAIGRFQGVDTRGLAAETLYEDRYSVVVRTAHPRFTRRITAHQYRQARHVFAGAAGETSRDEAHRDYSDLKLAAIVPQWLTALLLVSECDALVTCPRRLALRHADRLGLVVMDVPFPASTIGVSLLRRASPEDPAIDWLVAQVRACI